MRPGAKRREQVGQGFDVLKPTTLASMRPGAKRREQGHSIAEAVIRHSACFNEARRETPGAGGYIGALKSNQRCRFNEARRETPGAGGLRPRIESWRSSMLQ